jgi:NTP pyrophosphatase (non-canonical NTP hydrolase)
MNEPLTLPQIQQQVDHWIQEIGKGYFNELTNTAILMEEVGEVARIMARKYGQQTFKQTDTEVNLADEIADVLWVLVCLANQTGVDLQEAFKQNMEKKTRRDKNRFSK